MKSEISLSYIPSNTSPSNSSTQLSVQPNMHINSITMPPTFATDIVFTSMWAFSNEIRTQRWRASRESSKWYFEKKRFDSSTVAPMTKHRDAPKKHENTNKIMLCQCPSIATKQHHKLQIVGQCPSIATKQHHNVTMVWECPPIATKQHHNAPMVRHVHLLWRGTKNSIMQRKQCHHYMSKTWWIDRGENMSKPLQVPMDIQQHLNENMVHAIVTTHNTGTTMMHFERKQQ